MSALDIGALVLIAVASFGISYVGATVGLALGHFRVVLITYVLGSVVAGAATSMAISTVSTVTGAVGHARRGRVELVPLLLIGVPSAFAAYVSARYADHIDPRLLKLMIAAALLLAAAELFWHRTPDARTLTVASPIAAGAVQVVIGLLLGAISGLVGLLLGSVRLPAMVRLGVNPATAVGTNMAIGAVTGFSAGASTLIGGKVNLVAFAVIGPAALLGSHFGVRMTSNLSARALTRWIACALVLTALIMVLDVVSARAR